VGEGLEITGGIYYARKGQADLEVVNFMEKKRNYTWKDLGGLCIRFQRLCRNRNA